MTASTMSSLMDSRSIGFGSTTSLSIISTEVVGEGGGVRSSLEACGRGGASFLGCEAGRGLCDSPSWDAFLFLLVDGDFGDVARADLAGAAVVLVAVDGELRRAAWWLPGRAIPRLGRLSDTFLVLYPADMVMAGEKQRKIKFGGTAVDGNKQKLQPSKQ